MIQKDKKPFDKSISIKSVKKTSIADSDLDISSTTAWVAQQVLRTLANLPEMTIKRLAVERKSVVKNSEEEVTNSIWEIDFFNAIYGLNTLLSN